MTNTRNRLLVAAILSLVPVTGCRTTGSPGGESAVKVIGGVAVEPSKFEAVVLMALGNTGICTGTFVNETTVLTAAHCVDLNDPTGGVLLKGGIKSVKVFFHSTYQQLKAANHPQQSLYDQAVLVFPEGTAEQLGISKFVELSATPITVNSQMVIAGWGATELVGSTGAGTFRLGEGQIHKIQGDTIAFMGVNTHSDQATGMYASTGAGDSGGPMFNASIKMVGTAVGANPMVNQNQNIYLSATGALAKSLYKRAINCPSAPCAKNFANSGVVASGGGGSSGGGAGMGTNVTLCGIVTVNTTVCINGQRTLVNIISVSSGIEAPYQVQQAPASNLFPGGRSYLGVANLAHIQGLAPAVQVTLDIGPNNQARLSYLTQAGWKTFGGVDTFLLKAQ